MNVQTARVWIIKASLIITGLCFGFFLLAPALGYPTTFDQALRLLEIITPVFLAYLGSATYFLFGKDASNIDLSVRGSTELFSILVRGPVYLFGFVVTAAIAAFGYSNRVSAPVGSGMSIDALAASLSASLGLLAVTTNVVVTYLFSGGQNGKKTQDDT